MTNRKILQIFFNKFKKTINKQGIDYLRQKEQKLSIKVKVRQEMHKIHLHFK
jgi:hypothetical protein